MYGARRRIVKRDEKKLLERRSRVRMPSGAAKNWIFTLNNWSEEEFKTLEDFAKRNAVYAIIGKETGEGGTPHLQGYVYLTKRKRLEQLKRLSRRCHWEKAKGTPEQNRQYCSKDQDFTEYGVCPSGQGRRTDLAAVHEAIKNGCGRDELIELHFAVYARYHRFLDRYIQEQQSGRDWMPENIVYWGKTGTGKTRQVYAYHAREQIYKHTGERWFDGYRGQPIVLFDDFTGSVFPLHILLQLIDRYPMEVPIKGGFVNWVPKIIYFTSNLDPDTWYSGAHEEHQRALKRRLSTITKFE